MKSDMHFDVKLSKHLKELLVKDEFYPTSTAEIVVKLDEMIRAFDALENHSFTDVYVKYAIIEAKENLILIKSFLETNR